MTLGQVVTGFTGQVVASCVPVCVCVCVRVRARVCVCVLPRNRGKLSQVTSPYKFFINNHSVTFERNPILFYCSQEFTRNLSISQPS